MARFVYLDHMATTPPDRRVLAAMMPWLDGRCLGNPHAAHHRAGWQASEAVEEARASIAALIGARPGEIVLTSGATEANNLALRGACEERRIVVSAIEHPSVLECAEAMEREGCDIVRIGVDEGGRVDLETLEAAVADAPSLVSVMAASNETGVLQPIAEIGRICARHGARFHTDAVQALGTRRFDVQALPVDLLSLSGHKLCGPMGIGALFVREGVALSPMLAGGGQQEGRRPGTVPVPLAVGLGEACRIAAERRDTDARQLAALRERLFDGLAVAVPEIRRNGAAARTIASCLNVTFPGVNAADMLLDLPELALSTGSACSTGRPGPSHVLLAMGLSPEDAHGSVRFGLGRGTTGEDIELTVDRIARWFRAKAA